MATAVTGSQMELVPETTAHESGIGESFECSSGRIFQLELTIVRVIDQEALDVSIWGSADGKVWAATPLLRMPQQFYPGETRAVLDLSERPEVKFIQPRWEMHRWGRGRPVPVFRFRLNARQVG